jgi:predicted nucleic acid-binding protein
VKVLLDTSVLVPALVAAHPLHARAIPWLAGARLGTFEGLVAAHTLAELYATLTVLPVRPPLAPGAVGRLLEESVLAHCTACALAADGYRAVVASLVERRIVSGAVFDAVIIESGRRAGAERFVTFNIADFVRVAPDLAPRVILPPDPPPRAAALPL